MQVPVIQVLVGLFVPCITAKVRGTRGHGQQRCQSGPAKQAKPPVGDELAQGVRDGQRLGLSVLQLQRASGDLRDCGGFGALTDTLVCQ